MEERVRDGRVGRLILHLVENEEEEEEELTTTSWASCVQVGEWEVDESPEARLLKQTWPFGIIAKDRDGRPVQLYRMVCTDYAGYAKEVGMERVMRHNVGRINQEGSKAGVKAGGGTDSPL